MLSKRWGKECHSNDHERETRFQGQNDDTVNTGNNSKKEIGTGNIRGGDTVTLVNAGPNSDVIVLPLLNGNVIAPVIDLLSNPQLLGLGAVTGFNDADPDVDLNIR